MRSTPKAWIVIYLVIAATEGHPSNVKRLHQNEKPADLSRENRTNVNRVKEHSIGLTPDEKRSTILHRKVPAPTVDDDLLEFLVRIADNPAEWNKIRRVLSMLGRDETSASTVPPAVAAVDPTVDGVTVKTTVAVAARPWTPVPVTPPTMAAAGDDYRGRTQSPPPMTTVPAASSWPSSDWILETVEKIEAVVRAKGIRAGGATGVDPFDYEDGGDEDDDDDDDVADDEIEEIEGPTIEAAMNAPPPPPPPLPRAASGHMSRYLFRRIDGRAGDGRVNGTYVAVVESDRPPRGVVYDTARQKKPKPAT